MQCQRVPSHYATGGLGQRDRMYRRPGDSEGGGARECRVHRMEFQSKKNPCPLRAAPLFQAPSKDTFEEVDFVPDNDRHRTCAENYWFSRCQIKLATGTPRKTIHNARPKGYRTRIHREPRLRGQYDETIENPTMFVASSSEP
jgi:hypothetical protein